jgi:RNA-binding protein
VPELSSRQRAHLRSLAHPLRPIFQVGKDGLTENTVSAIRQSFARRELIKVRVLEGAPDDARELAARLAEAVGRGAAVVQVVGSVVTLYRSHPERPEITLPQ